MDINPSYSPLDLPTVEYVIDQRTKEEYPASKALPTDERGIAQARLKAFEDRIQGRPAIICAACHSPVYPKRSPDREHVFYSHFAGDSEDCPYQGHSANRDIGRIDAMRYNGQKEGADHVRMKDLLVESIRADTRNFVDDPKVEKNWYGSKDQKKWRRPDVAAIYKPRASPLRIAFEVQLSSTYLHVIAARRKFYLEENALLFWIFQDAQDIDPRQYQNDLFFNNNSNLFILDDETVALSRSTGKFYLRCRYLEPVLDEMNIDKRWREEIVSFDQLTLDTENQRAFFFDYDSTIGKTKEILLAQKDELEKAKAKELFSTIWECHSRHGWTEVEADYERLSYLLGRRGVPFPQLPSKNLERFAALVLTARDGKPRATGYTTLLEVANWGFDHGKRVLYYFYRVMVRYNRWEKLFDLDDAAGRKKKNRGRSHTSWREKKQLIYQKILAKDPEYVRDEDLLPLFQFLFPEIDIKTHGQ